MKTSNDKTKEELIIELENLQKEYDSLKSAYQNDTPKQLYQELQEAKEQAKESEIKFQHIITEQKLVDEALRENEEKYRILFESAGDIIFIVDTNGKILHVNPAATERLGYSYEELLSMNVSDLDSPENIPQIPERIAKLMKEGFYTFESAHISKSGKIIPIEVNSRKILLNGKVAIMSINRDITRRKQAEERIKSLSDIVKNSLNEIYIFSLDSLKFNFINSSGLKNLGYSLEECLELTPVDIKPEFTHETFLEMIQTLLKGEKEVLQFETIHKRKNGTTYPVEVNLQLSEYEEKKAFVAIILDITKRKEIEAITKESHERLLTILNGLDAIVYVADMNTYELLFVNKFVKDAFGDILKRPCWKYLQSEQTGPCEFCTNKKLIDSSGNPKEILKWEFQNTANGHWYDIRDRAIQWVDGRIVRLEIATDITDRKLAEQALSASEKRFRTMIDVSPVPMTLNDDEHRITFINQAFIQTFGYSHKEIPTLAEWWPRAYPDPVYRQWIANTWQANLEEAKRTNGHFSPLEVMVKCKDGTDKIVIASATSFTNSFEGNHLVALYDITKQKQIEQTLRASEEKFKNLFNNSEVGMFRTRLDGSEILEFNDKYLSILGKTREECIGKPSQLLWVDPKERQAMVEILKAKGHIEDFECRLIRKDGKIINCITSLKYYPQQGILEGSIIDITDRKQAEQALRESENKYRELVENSPDAIAIYVDGKVIFVNNECVRLVKANSPEALIGKSVLQFVHPEYHSIVIERMKIASIERTTLPLTEEKFIRFDGSEVDVEVKALPIQFEGSSAVQLIIRDITDRKKAEDSLKATNKSLEEMVYIASHDLQVPLVSMEGYATELLESYGNKFDEEGKYCLTRLQTNARRMHKLVLSLLDISRLNTKKNPHEKFNLNLILEKIIQDISLTIEKHNATISIDKLPELYADKIRVEGVFRNLIINSLNYEGKNIYLGYENDKIFVKDDGIGIPPSQLERIFNAGERLKKNNAEGVGMGLTFCRKVIEQHNGKIWAESDGENKGTTIYIKLPPPISIQEEE